jgi:hypothetical protein
MVLPVLSGMAGMARAATRGSRMIVVSQGNSMGGMVEDIYLFACVSIVLSYMNFCKLLFPRKNTQPS